MSKNIIVLLVVVGLFVLIGAVAYRPAFFIGVQPGALAHSVGDGGDGVEQKCVERGDDVWSCRVAEGNSGSAEYAVKTRRFGCWDAWRGKKAPGSPNEVSHSGCINGLDFALGD